MGFVESVGDAIKGAICTNLRLGDTANQYFNELSPIDLPNFSKYWRPKLCDDDPAQVIPPAPPFQGGQCPTSYDVVVQVRFRRSNNSEYNANFTRIATGPIGGVSIGALTGNPTFNTRVSISGAAPVTVVDGRCPANINVDCPIAASIISVSRRDGQPDNCGDPPPIIAPYQPITINISPTYIDNSGNTVNLNGSFTLFAPIAIFAPITTILAPVKVDLGGVNFNGTVELAPNFNFNFGTPPGFSGPGQPTGTAPDEDPQTSPDTPEDEGEMKLIGIVVRSQPSAGTQTTELDETNAPDLFVPRLANAYFRTRNGTVLGWYGPIDIKTTSAFVPVPPNVNAVDARVSYQKGWSGSFIKILGQKQTIS